MSLPLQILLAAICFVAGFVLTGFLRLLPGFLPDIPNERSSHSRIVPRGGGLGIAVPALGAAVVLYATSGTLFHPSAMALLIGSVAMLTLGLIDDAFRLGIAVRLLAETTVAMAVAAAGLPDRIMISDSLMITGPAAIACQSLAMVAALNFFNFMDGIDSLAAVQTVFAGLGLAVFLFSGSLPGMPGVPPHGAVALTLAGAAAGFLLWNLPPASIFMGDGGTYFLGFILSYLALTVVGMGADLGLGPSGANLGIIAAIAVWFMFLLDPLITLLRRVALRENPFRAHRDHLYQLLYHGGWSTGGVVGALLLGDALVVGAVLLGGLLGGGIWAIILPGAAMLMVGVAYAVLRFRVAAPEHPARPPHT